MHHTVPTDDPILVDERRAAEKLGLSAKTLFNMRRDGQLPFVRARGRILYRVGALNRWAEEQEQLSMASK